MFSRWGSALRAQAFRMYTDGKVYKSQTLRSIQTDAIEFAQMNSHAADECSPLRKLALAVLRQLERDSDRTYGNTEGNIGSDKGQDFWSAARQIIQETYKVLAPGSHAIWVVKGFVRKRTYVDFPDQWRQLCEAVGFETLHWHRAWLTEKGTQQHRFDGGVDDNSVERKSFFRRLAEKNGSPRIDFEVVLCMVKR